MSIRIKVLIILIIVFLLSSSIVLAFWFSGITGNSDSLTKNLNVGVANDVETILEINTPSLPYALVPTGLVGVSNVPSGRTAVDVLIFTYVVTWEEVGGNLMTGHDAILNVGLNPALPVSLPVAVRHLINIEFIVSHAIVLNGVQVSVDVVVTLERPANAVQYTAVINQPFSFGLIFSLNHQPANTDWWALFLQQINWLNGPFIPGRALNTPSIPVADFTWIGAMISGDTFYFGISSAKQSFSGNRQVTLTPAITINGVLFTTTLIYDIPIVSIDLSNEDNTNPNASLGITGPGAIYGSYQDLFTFSNVGGGTTVFTWGNFQMMNNFTQFWGIGAPAWINPVVFLDGRDLLLYQDWGTHLEFGFRFTNFINEGVN
jgi:hypothetical protein